MLYPFEWLLIPAAYYSIQKMLSTGLGVSYGRSTHWKGICLGAASLFFGVILFLMGPSPTASFMRGFQEWTKARIKVDDFERMRTGLLALNGRGKHECGLTVEHGDELVKKLTLNPEDAPDATVFFTDAGQPTSLVISWGGGFEKWGLIYSLDGRSPHANTALEFRAWSNGVYFFSSRKGSFDP